MRFSLPLQVVSNLTYNRMAMHEDVDTHTLRKALWNYIHCLYGIRSVPPVEITTTNQAKVRWGLSCRSLLYLNLFLVPAQLWWLWLRQCERAPGALSEGVCQNHDLSPRADHGTCLPRLLETLQTLREGTNSHITAIIWHFKMFFSLWHF